MFASFVLMKLYVLYICDVLKDDDEVMMMAELFALRAGACAKPGKDYWTVSTLQ
jgi:hypothetical protein